MMTGKVYSLLFVTLFIINRSYSLELWDYYKERTFQCVPIQEKFCTGLGYNYTTSPNIMGDDNQKEASRRFMEFKPLIDYQYSEKFRFFLCTLFFPMCTKEVNVGIPACRPMCEEMRKERGPIMKMLGFEWSDSIDCSQLPWESVEDHLCIPHPSYDDEEQKKENSEAEIEENIFQPSLMNPHLSINEYELEPQLEIITSNSDEQNDENSLLPIDLLNPMDSSLPEITVDDYEEPYPHSEDYNYENEENTDHYALNFPETPDIDIPFHETSSEPPSPPSKCKNPNKFVFVESTGTCVPRCGVGMDIMFSQSDKFNAFLVLSVCASLCFVSTAITVATFLIDSSRFRYPERPFMFLSLCYNVYSVGYLLRSVKGSNLPISCVHNTVIAMDHLVVSGHKDTSCYASFVLLYFFGMAASSWWVILNVTFLLSAGFKWGHEAIEKYGTYLHCLAWSIPLAQTVVALFLAKVDGNELTGMCYIGNLDQNSLMYFVIIPLTLYLLIGTVALFLGLCYLFKILRVMKSQNIVQAGSLEKLITKIGFFSVFYAFPAACVLAANFYQYQHLQRWKSDAQNTFCYHPTIQNFNYLSSFNEQQLQNPPFRSWSVVDENSDYSDFKQTANIHQGNYITEFRSNEGHLDSTVSKSRFQLDEFGSNINMDVNCRLRESIAFYMIYFCKISMSLLPGIMSVIWIFSAKTLDSWIKFFKLCYCRKKQRQGRDVVEERLFPNGRNIADTSEDENQYEKISNSEDVTYSMMRNAYYDDSNDQTHMQNHTCKAVVQHRGHFQGPNKTNRQGLRCPCVIHFRELQQHATPIESSDDVFAVGSCQVINSRQSNHSLDLQCGNASMNNANMNQNNMCYHIKPVSNSRSDDPCLLFHPTKPQRLRPVNERNPNENAVSVQLQE